MIFLLLNSTIFLNKSTINETRFKTLDTYFTGAILSSEDLIAYLNKKYAPDTFFQVCKEKLASANLCIYFQKNSCFTHEFNHHILKLTSNGLIDSWAFKQINKSFLKYKQLDNSPKKLSISQLGGGFRLLEVGLVAGLVLFVLELISMKLQLVNRALNFFH